MPTRRIGFARWTSDQPSGGNRYDAELADRLPGCGIDLHEYPVAGPWPLPGPGDVDRLLAVLPSERHWLIGNILGSAAPQALRAVRAAGGRVTLLVHYFPADDPALPAAARGRLAEGEAEAVELADAVVVTSEWAAGEVARRYRRTDVTVAPPGVEAAPPATGSLPLGSAPALLWLGRLTATKDPLTFLSALDLVRELPWTARLVGPDAVEPSVSRQVTHRIEATGLAGRVAVTGPRVGPALEAVWGATDLLVHTSRAETYGMVVAEALARGIPAVVASGTGAVEALRVGAAFPAGDPAALAEVLRGWLADPVRQHRWRTEAARLSADRPTWQATAEAVATALAG